MPVILSAIGRCYNISSPGVTQVSHMSSHYVIIQCVKHSFGPSLIFPYHDINHRNSCEILSMTFYNVVVYETNTFLTYHHMDQEIVKLLIGVLPRFLSVSFMIILAHLSTDLFILIEYLLPWTLSPFYISRSQYEIPHYLI